MSECRFVFDNYTWSRGESDYSVYNLKPIPSRIPLTALIKGARIPHADTGRIRRFINTVFQDQL